MPESLSHILVWAIPAIHVLGLIAAIAAVMRTRTSQGAIAWALSLIFLPYVALPMYLVFGRDRFEGYRRRLRLTVTRHRGQSMSVIDALAAQRAFLPGPRALDQRVIERITGQVFTRGNRVDLLIDGKAKFDALLPAIRAATTEVLVQYYILRDDKIGRLVLAALVDRARAGVRVLVLYDAMGCFFLSRNYVRVLREAGGQVLAFRTARAGRAGIQINFRNHRKAVIIDGRVAFLGGINVGDEYLGADRRLSPWRDTHLRVEGPAVLDLQMAFAADWYWASDTIPTMIWSPPEVDQPADGVLACSSGPADSPERLPALLLYLIGLARRRIWIATPYFVPDPATLAALRVAALRGVDVRILMPDRSDHLPSWLAAFTYFASCEEAGVRLFRYRDGFMHQKAWLFDDDLAAVGSVNLDNRSMRLNFEQTVLVCDRAFAGRVEQMLSEDLGRSREASAREFTGRRWSFRLAARLARLLEPVL